MQNEFELTQKSKSEKNELLKNGSSGIVLRYSDGTQKVLPTGTNSGRTLRENGILDSNPKPIAVGCFISIEKAAYAANPNVYWQYWYTYDGFLAHLQMC